MLRVCGICCERAERVFGSDLFDGPASSAVERIDARAVLDNHSNCREGVVCSACCGLLQFRGSVADTVRAAVVDAPFADCSRLSVNPSVPRVLSYSFAAVCFAALAAQDRVASVEVNKLADGEGASDGVGALGHLPGEDGQGPRVIVRSSIVPAAISGFVRDTAIASIGASVYTAFGIGAAEVDEDAAEAAGSDAAVAGATKRPRSEGNPGGAASLKLSARVDDDDTIIADADMDISLRPMPAEDETGGVVEAGPPVRAFVARKQSADLSHTAAAESGSALARAFTRLPAEFQSNKASVPVTWGMIEEVFLPALVSDAERPPPCQLRIVPTVHVWRSSAYVFGFYRKMMRDVPQSPWFLDGVRFGRLSLQEVIAQRVLPLFYPAEVLANAADHIYVPGGRALKPKTGEEHIFGCSLYRFASAGREDVDVRMLGSGRPFTIELLSPHRVASVSSAELFAAEQAVNEESEDVEVDRLGVAVDRSISLVLHRLSEEKKKRYRCVCYCSRALRSDDDERLVALNGVTELTVSQQTPVRVLHRRSQKARDKVIHSIQVRRVSEHWLVVDLETQAGAYVKEWCHGDLGRTTPSLGDFLGGFTDIIQLDVVGVDLEAPLQHQLERLLITRSAQAA